MLATAPNPLATWENEDGPRRCVNTAEGLTHSSDLSREGLAVDATQSTDVARAIGLVMATGASPHQVFSFRLDGEPIAKARVRIEKTRHYARGRTEDAELDIAREIQRGSAPPWFSGNVAVAAVFYRSNRHRVDVDNLLKTVLDGITKSGLVWADDDQVTALLGIVEYDEDCPRIDVAIAHHQSTMLRGDARLTHTCETCGAKYRPHSLRQGPSRYCSRTCRPGRAACIDCGGRTSHSSVKRCRSCHDLHRGVATQEVLL